MTDSRLCLVTGVGPGTGKAIVERFAKDDYKVAMLARDANRLDKIAAETNGTYGYVCDVSDETSLSATISSVQNELGPVSCLIHNAVGGAFGSFLDVEPDVFEQNFRINALALYHMARQLAPAMIDAGEGVILGTGNTSAYRGKDRFAAFAPTKAAQRILLESMARTLGPQGIHCGYVAIDAVIDVPWAREAFADQPDEFFAKPVDIAAEVYHVAHQPKSTWTFDTIIRPFGENW